MTINAYRIGRLEELVLRPDDIFIVSYPRSGTTWLQMILYQLTTDGNMKFPHISQVCPWFERTILGGVLPVKEIESRLPPRIFKSHLPYQKIPKGACKYIYIVRNGEDVAVSYYHFYTSHLGFQSTFNEFFEHYFMRGKVQYGSWFKHVAGWMARQADPQVLFLTYEGLKQDLEEGLRKIIDFCGLEVSEERLPEILERCSFAFMKKHEDKFDHLLEVVWEGNLQKNAFLRKGQIGEGKSCLTSQQQELFDQTFENICASSMNINFSKALRNDPSS